MRHFKLFRACARFRWLCKSLIYIYICIQLSFPYIHLSTHILIYLSIPLLNYLYDFPSPYIYEPIFIYFSIYLCTYQFIYVFLSNYTSFYPSVHLFFHLPISYLPIHKSICALSLYLSDHLFISI